MFKKNKFIRLLLICILTFVSGCSTSPDKPDLYRLYKLTSSDDAITPVILIHGILGSKIRSKTNQKEMWSGGIFNTAFSNYEELTLEVDPVTLNVFESYSESYAIFDNFMNTDYYGKIIKALTEIGG